ncbi:extracellular solute-binding protein family 5 [Halococcus hamelinensis 100A6]|uniref:Extracellular solute-binding protein family 5 n=1 Tax=Halococcus hamelinensis 100A6 TaxID=1132509 RepID=M0LVJ6_9EURY|nr:extracellular solute-binding protein family 5 [Halococcus hamelinensis 100A6]
MLFGRLAQYNQTSAEWVPHLAEEWNISGTSVTLNLNDSFVWHDGDPVTAKDVATKLRVEYAMETTLANFLSGVEVPDETTIEIELQGETNRNLLYQNLLSLMIDTPTSVWGEYVSDVQFDDSDYSSVQEEIVQFSWQDPIGWGPFQLDDQTGQQIQLTKFDDHPQADQINFSTMAFRYVENKQQKMQGYLSERISGGGMIPTKSVYDQMPSAFQNWNFNRGVGFALHFNQNRKVFQDVRVRKALSHVLDRGPMVENTSIVGPKTLEFDTGFHGNKKFQRRYIGDTLNEFTLYNDTKRATALLKEAGFTKNGEKWTKPNGDPFQLTLKSASGFSAWRVGTNEATRQLNEFGIDAEFTPVQNSTYLSNTLSNGDFDIGASFVGQQILHPLTDLETSFYGYPSFAPDIGTPDEFSVPMPVANPSGSTKTVNVRDLISRITSTSGQKSQDLIKRLSWVYNQTMPTYVVFTSYGYSFLNTDNWTVPPEDAATNGVSYPVALMMHKGQVRAKQ